MLTSSPGFAARSDVGRTRDNNEDRVVCDRRRSVFAVIDGVGGEAGGEEAARIAEEYLLDRLSRRTGTPEQILEQAITLANTRILDEARSNPRLEGMSCVITALVLEARDQRMEAIYGHVGDTRLYRLSPGQIEKITRDHSFVGKLEDSGQLSEEDAMRHPRRSEILRDLGSEEHDLGDAGFIDIGRLPFPPDSAFLLCSDGLSDQVSSHQIRKIVEGSADDPRRVVERLVVAANEAGGKDNVSVVLLTGAEYAAAVRRAEHRARNDLRSVPERVPARGIVVSEEPGRAPAKRAAPGASRREPSAGPWRRLAVGAGVSLLLLLALAMSWDRLLPWLEARVGGLGTIAPRGESLVVPESGFATLQEAIDAARPGTTLLVEPGRYSEALRLRSGVSLVSAQPGGAVLAPISGEAVVRAEGVREVRFEGFRLEAAASVTIGLELIESELQAVDLEISGASLAAVRTRGADRSRIERSVLRNNAGAALRSDSGTALWFLDNLVQASGTAAGRSAVEVAEGAHPRISGNRFTGGAVPVVCGPATLDEEKLFAWNQFGELRRDQAVRLGTPGCGAGR